MKQTRTMPKRGPGMGMGPKEKLNKDTVKKLAKYITKNYKKYLIIVLICIIISSIAQVSGQLFLKSLIDDCITPLIGSTNPNFQKLITTIMQMALIYVIGIISALIYNYLMIKVSQGVLRDIRDDMFIHMETLKIKYFDTNSHGDIMSHYTNDTDTLRQMISQSIPQCTSSIITIITIFIAMLYLNVILTLVIVISVIFIRFVSSKIISSSTTYFVNQQESLGNLNGYIEEMMEGQKVIKVFTHESVAKKDFDKLNNELCENGTKANMYANTLMPILANLGNLTYVIVAILGGTFSIILGGISIGTIASFLTMTRSFIMPINQVSQQINYIIMALAGATRIFELMEEEPEENLGCVTLVNIKKEKGKLIECNEDTNMWAWKLPKNKNSELIELKGDVRFKDVQFGYNDDKQILYDINLYAKPGQKIAFVGSTGAGKTTITNLINRFYDVNSGDITYDGINIKDINKNDLRKSLGMVLQDTNLFTGTIMENIRYGKKDATDEECIAAAKLANADKFIEMLPNGYQTVITGNGASLSQGQRQLLSIARAAVADPPVMILDEATSSIDTRTESLVQKGMDKLMEGRTVFVIAHRLSTIKNAKAIMVLENGHIIERGDHNELLALKGKYYQLYTGALELE